MGLANRRSEKNRAAVYAHQDLFALEADHCGPAALGGVDCKETCRVGGNLYAVKLNVPKSNVAGANAAHNEWFCASLAQRVGLLCPKFEQIKHCIDGQVWFGSQWIHGEKKDWYITTQDFSCLVDDWSRIFAFDLFIYNSDRHLKNFLCIPEGKNFRFYVMDHSRAWLFNGFPLMDLPMPDYSNTVQACRKIKEKFGVVINRDVAIDILDKIQAISGGDIDYILRLQPDGWLARSRRRAIIAWWNKEAIKRIAVIKKGIADGTFI